MSSYVVLLTANFPYYPGEQFLESEIPFWDRNDIDLTVLPLVAIGTPRSIPEPVQVELALTKRWRRRFRLFALLRAVVSSLFFRELIWLLRQRKLSMSRAFYALKVTAKCFIVYDELKLLSRRAGGISLVYSYWNDIGCYGALLAKRRGFVAKVVSRAHGYDLYEWACPFEYAPLRRQFVLDIDLFMPISNQGYEYGLETYGYRAERCLVRRLGVVVPKESTPAGPKGTLAILSVSGCIAVKRVDRIIDAIGLLAARCPDLTITWCHIGSGGLLDDLKARAAGHLGVLANTKYEFLGQISNNDVHRYYCEKVVDVFLNCSSSEGVPVSIMEAMAHGVPAIAPEVGGVSEIVVPSSGLLLSAEPSPREICDRLQNSILPVKSLSVRMEAKRLVAQHFNADIIYRDFVESMIDLTKADG